MPMLQKSKQDVSKDTDKNGTLDFVTMIFYVKKDESLGIASASGETDTNNNDITAGDASRVS